MSDDPTRVRNQPALTRSTGTIWLVVGAALTLVTVAVLAVLAVRQPVVAWTASGIAIALYLAMVIVRLTVDSRRSVVLAVLMIALALTGLGGVLVVLALESAAA